MPSSPSLWSSLGGFYNKGLKTVTKLERQLAGAVGREEGEVVRHHAKGLESC